MRRSLFPCGAFIDELNHCAVQKVSHVHEYVIEYFMLVLFYMVYPQAWSGSRLTPGSLLPQPQALSGSNSSSSQSGASFSTLWRAASGRPARQALHRHHHHRLPPVLPSLQRS